ncbi:rhodanese-like domain-containing protein [Marinilactibacillus piezotolerans]|uniref:rhodanese-like domain-containing protein n=1 Tax=Marinilactibacillus piezotolerans TaxID=258723 RepID=UPI0009B01B96|nr:rhodanese-like domain-containing protein [Marinilactibacillus piezotolerans]
MYKSISMSEFEHKWNNENVTLIDVRELDEWETGHVEGAQHIPLSKLDEYVNQLDKNTPYYVMCHSGGRSAMACQRLSAEGIDTVNILGGISAWKGDKV